MRTALLIVLVLVAGAGFAVLVNVRGSSGAIDVPAPKKAAPAPRWPDQIEANGVVEGARPEAALRTEGAGILATIQVRENQDVARGALLAELSNEAQKAAVAVATADLAISRANLEHLRNGERAEKRKAVAAAEQAKHVLFQLAKGDWERTHKLTESRSASREQNDRDYFAMLRAQAEWDQAAAENALIQAPARAEEVAASEGQVNADQARLRLAEAELAKTRLLAPTSGRVLRLYAEPGEAAGPTTPQPVILMADLTKHRVRAFVEELDAARVKVGQRAQVTADGVPGKVFAGKVTEVMPRMGRRGLDTDNPGEYKDLYFREVLIELEAADELPLNLRVHTRIPIAPGGISE
jgi:multidrug resistance efflux pump